MKIRFDPFEFDTEQKTVVGPEGPVVLRAQTLAVLGYLIERAPAVVSRDELLDAVWGHQATSISSVAQTIKELRHALGDSSTTPRLIATRRRLGYQFIGSVERPSPHGKGADPADAIPAPASAGEGWFYRILPACAMVVIGFALWWMLVGDPSPVPASSRPPTLAVAAMVNSTDDPGLNWIGPALELNLGHALVELGGFRVLAVDAPSPTDESRLSGIDFLVEGRYMTAGVDGTRLFAHLRRPGSSDIMTSLESTHSEWDITRLSIDMASAIRDRLGFAAPADADPATLRTRLPSNTNSQRAYFAARQAIVNLRAEEALVEIARAREFEPHNPRLDHLEALAQRARGDWPSAREASERTLVATRLWPRRDRLEFEATAALLAFDYERAADNLQALAQFYPEPDINRRLVEALIESGRVHAAGEALASLQLQWPRDPQVVLLDARLAHLQRNHQRQLEATNQAVDLARELESPALLTMTELARANALVEAGEPAVAREVLDALLAAENGLTATQRAEARLILARVHFRQGDLQPAIELAELAELEFGAIPHSTGMAESALVAGAIHERAGRVEASVLALQTATTLFETLGDKRRLAHAQINFGITLMRINRNDGAIERFTQAARYFRAAQDRQGEGAALLNHATLLARTGRVADAEPLLERAREAFEDAGDLRGQAMALGNLAGIAGDRRDMRRSVELAEAALELFEMLGAQTDIARVSYNLGLVQRRTGDLLSAEYRIEQAAQAFASQGATLMQVRALTTLAAMRVKMGRYAEVEPILETLDGLVIEDAAEQAVVDSVLGERELSQGNLDTARLYFGNAYQVTSSLEGENHVLVSRLNLARVDLAEGRSVTAEQTARELIFAFAEIRSVNREIDARLMLVESLIEQHRGTEAVDALNEAERLLVNHPDAEQRLLLALLRSRTAEPQHARERLEWVEKTAGEQGFLPLMLIARDRLNAAVDS